MKRIRSYIFAFLTVSLLSSCYELDKLDPNQQNEDAFWQSEVQLRMGAYACYDVLQLYYGRLAPEFHTPLSDEGTNEYPYEFNDLVRFKGDDLNRFQKVWNPLYDLIGRAYQVIYWAPQIEGPNVLAITAEARFFIAFAYFQLQMFFGDHVAKVESVQTGADKPLRAEAGEIYAIMERELLLAIEDLPLATSYSSSEYGLISKGAAQALLGKVYMQQHKYTEAEQVLKEVIDSDQYLLNEEYAINFDGTEFVNREAVFSVVYVVNGSEVETSNDFARRTRYYSLSEANGAYGDVQATNFILESFNTELDKDGNPDPRRDETIFHENSTKGTYYGEDWYFWYENVQNPDIISMFYKYSEQESAMSNGGVITNKLCGTDCIVIRYADLLLLYAEALNQLGRTSEAYTYVDIVRARSNMNDLASAHAEIGSDMTAFHDQLKHERLVELANEMVRIEDLKRWGDYGPNSAINDPNFETFIVGRSELAPIPQSEIDLNENLIQNPGY